jgi:hypothetical protein
MTEAQKSVLMNATTHDLNEAKYALNKAVETLAEGGMRKDAERLYKIIFRIEAIQNQYDPWSLYYSGKRGNSR